MKRLLKVLGLILLLPLVLGFLPFFLGGGIAWYLWKKKKIQNTKLRYALIAISIVTALLVGSSWIAAMSSQSPTQAQKTLQPTHKPIPTTTSDDIDSGDTVLPPKFKAYSSNTVQNLQDQTNSITPNTNTYCSSNPLEHVYHPQRLQIINNCIQVSGIVDAVKAEPDGDYHINIKLDKQFADLINDKNIADEHGDLVVETVCEHSVTQTDAESTCTNYHSEVTIPSPGAHVFIVGAYVLDRDHGWMEIHPSTYIGNSTINVSVPTSSAPTTNTSPNSNTNTFSNTSSTTQAGQATGRCNDGTETDAINHRGACSHHGGVAIWY